LHAAVTDAQSLSVTDDYGGIQISGHPNQKKRSTGALDDSKTAGKVV